MRDTKLGFPAGFTLSECKECTSGEGGLGRGFCQAKTCMIERGSGKETIALVPFCSGS